MFSLMSGFVLTVGPVLLLPMMHDPLCTASQTWDFTVQGSPQLQPPLDIEPHYTGTLISANDI